MERAIETASCGMICIPSFMEFGAGVQAVLRFCFRRQIESLRRSG
jgi:hypothetical protein